MLAALLLAGLLGPGAPAQAKDCSGTSVGFTPLNNPGGGVYKGKNLGLYPGATNTRPNESAVLAAARSIGPVDANGNPDPNGRYGLISIGMSNTEIEFKSFIQKVGQDGAEDSDLVVANGAHGGVDAKMWANPQGQWWTEAENLNGTGGLTPEQVQVAWVKLATGAPTGSFVDEAERLKGYLADVARILKDRFPNIKIAYYSSRIYAGYATKGLNPEPYAYEGAFSVKWLIDDQLEGNAGLNSDPSKGPVQAPLVTWGPYLWADGIKTNSEGLAWLCSDFLEDGTHPSDAGSEKVAGRLLDYFKSDSTARRWYTNVATIGVMRTTLETNRQKVGYLRAFTLSGRWSGDAGCNGPFKVEIRKRVLGKKTARPIASVAVGGNGSWSFTHRSERSAAYTAAATPTENCDGDSSKAHRVLTRAKVTAHSSDGCSSPQRISGRVKPNHKHTRVRLQRRAAGSWKTIDKDKLNKQSSYVVFASKCSGRYRVLWPQQAPDNLRGTRSFLALTGETRID